MSNFRIMLLSTAAIGLAGALATPASAGEVEKSASFSGHVNRVVGIIDDGDSTDIHSADAGASMSRVRFTGSAVGENLTAKAYIEVRARGNDSDTNGNPTSSSTTANSGATTGGTGASGNTLSMRHSYVSLSNSMGTLILGETNPSGDLNGVFSGDFSGANWWGVEAASASPISSNFLVENVGNAGGQEEGGQAGSNPVNTLSSGRGGVIRYDSPEFNGVSFSTSLKGGADAAEEWSASVGYSADFDGTKVGAGYGYTNRSGSSASQDAFHSVGAGLELASGINAHVGYFKKIAANTGGIEPETWNIQMGYDMNVIDAGETSVGVSYTNGDELLNTTDDGQWYGLNVNQSLADYGTDIYGGISKGEYDRTGTNYEDITAGWVGVRVKF